MITPLFFASKTLSLDAEYSPQRERRLISRRRSLHTIACGALVGAVGVGNLGAVSRGTAHAQDGEIVQVVQWVEGGELLLSHGERIVLQDIVIPTAISIESQRGRSVFLSTLSRFSQYVVGRNIQIYRQITTFVNKNQRKFAHVYLEGGKWLQHELVSSGVAWVLPSRYSETRLMALYRAEYEARNQELGLWGTGDFSVYDVNDPSLVMGRNYILYGRVAQVGIRSGELVVNFVPAVGDDRVEVLPHVVISQQVTKNIKKSGYSLSAGQLIRVRGWLSPGAQGRRLFVQNAAQIEAI